MRFFGGTQNISNRINDYIKKNKKLEVPKWNLKIENKKIIEKKALFIICIREAGVKNLFKKR